MEECGGAIPRMWHVAHRVPCRCRKCSQAASAPACKPSQLRTYRQVTQLRELQLQLQRRPTALAGGSTGRRARGETQGQLTNGDANATPDLSSRDLTAAVRGKRRAADGGCCIIPHVVWLEVTPRHHTNWEGSRQVRPGPSAFCSPRQPVRPPCAAAWPRRPRAQPSAPPAQRCAPWSAGRRAFGSERQRQCSNVMACAVWVHQPASPPPQAATPPPHTHLLDQRCVRLGHVAPQLVHAKHARHCHSRKEAGQARAEEGRHV